MQLELFEYRDLLTFNSEYQLTSEPLWLNSLRDNLQEREISTILDKGEEQSKKINIDAYLDVVLRANSEKYTEVHNMYRPTLLEIWKDTTFKDDLMELGRKEEKLAIARNLLAEGSTPEFVCKITGLPTEEIEKL